jgi:ATP-dependent DNA helicase RecQ
LSFISSFDRKNLSLEVRPALDRVKQIIDFISNKPSESGIIYCLSRKTTEELAGKTSESGH